VTRPPLRLRVRDRLVIWFGLVTLLSTALALGLGYREAARAAVQEFGGKLAAVAASGALLIDGDEFAALREPAQMSSAPYRRIQAQLRRLRSANAGLRFRYLYTMAPGPQPGLWRYLVDSAPRDAADFSPLGATEDFSRGDVVVDAYRTGRPAADRHLRDYPEWGPLLSAAAPIRDRAGRVVGILGVDAPASSVAAIRRRLLQAAAICLAVGLLVACLAGIVVAWSLTRPLGALVAGAAAVGRGDLAYRVEIPNRDELGQLAAAFNRMTQGLRQRDLYKQQFERYVSRQIAEKILAEPERAFWQGERRRATILFADIRGFTTMAERMPPEEVVNRLNQYLTVMIDIIFEWEGTLDKFIGDAIMAVFGAPVSLGNDEERALRAAIAMRAATDDLCRRWEGAGGPGFRIGIGIDTGEVVVGNIGSERRLEYAAIGDHVNVAARLERLNRDYNTTILIGENTYRAVAHLVEARHVDSVRVRGREQPVEVYELLGLRAPAP